MKKRRDTALEKKAPIQSYIVSVRSFGPSIGYHGCSQETADAVLLRGENLKPSTNEYDWLGHGIYFWLDSPERAFQWAKNKTHPAVIGAVINPGHCLNLADSNNIQSVQEAYQALSDAYERLGMPLPKNKSPDKQGLLLRRTLDCKVIEVVHELRLLAREQGFDSVLGVFEEGSPMFPGAAMKEHTHVQIAVRNPANILGYFRPARLSEDLKS